MRRKRLQPLPDRADRGVRPRHAGEIGERHPPALSRREGAALGQHARATVRSRAGCRRLRAASAASDRRLPRRRGVGDQVRPPRRARRGEPDRGQPIGLSGGREDDQERRRRGSRWRRRRAAARTRHPHGPRRRSGRSSGRSPAATSISRRSAHRTSVGIARPRRGRASHAGGARRRSRVGLALEERRRAELATGVRRARAGSSPASASTSSARGHRAPAAVGGVRRRSCRTFAVADRRRRTRRRVGCVRRRARRR